MNGKPCPVCGEGRLREHIAPFTATFEDSKGQPKQLSIRDLKTYKCEACGEDILDEAAEARVAAERRVALGLLTPERIKDLRLGLGKTQLQMSALLGVGEKTYCRWESGAYIQSEASDRYLRLLMQDPEAVEALELIALTKGGLDIKASAEVFEYIEDFETAERGAAIFSEVLDYAGFEAA